MVTGGWNGTSAINDCWILDVESREWREVSVSEFWVPYGRQNRYEGPMKSESGTQILFHYCHMHIWQCVVICGSPWLQKYHFCQDNTWHSILKGIPLDYTFHESLDTSESPVPRCLCVYVYVCMFVHACELEFHAQPFFCPDYSKSKSILFSRHIWIRHFVLTNMAGHRVIMPKNVLCPTVISSLCILMHACVLLW